MQWAEVPQTPQDPATGPAAAPLPAPEDPAEDASESGGVPAAETTGELVLPDGYIYDTEGYAHPVYGGYVYDDEGTAHPVESLVSGTVEPPVERLETAPRTARSADSFTFDRFTTVDPAKWGFGTDGTASSRSASRQAQRARRRRRILPTLLAVLVLVGLVGVAVTVLMPESQEAPVVATPSDDFPGPGSGTVEVVVNQGDGESELAQALLDAGVVKSVSAFARAWAADPEAGQIAHGTYALLQEMRAEEALAWLQDESKKIELRVTIPAGFTVDQVLRIASSKTQIPLEAYEAAAETPRKLGVPKSARKQLEGWLFPGEYTVQPGDTAEQVLAAMVAQTRKVLKRLDVPEEEWEAVLTKASLVETVIPRPKDRGKAARVIQTRLDKGMALGIDATLAYGLGKPPAELTEDELIEDHAYNTRVRTGLPPTPIGSPGRGSIAAVVDPPEGLWEYWVIVNLMTGETLFAETYSEYLEHTELADQWLAEHGRPDDEQDGDE